MRGFLLYVQAELIEREKEFQQFALEDTTSEDPHRIFYSRQWSELNKSLRGGDDS